MPKTSLARLRGRRRSEDTEPVSRSTVEITPYSADPLPVSPDMMPRESETKPSIMRSEEHTSELQSLMRISYAVFCLNKNKKTLQPNQHQYTTMIHTHKQHQTK